MLTAIEIIAERRISEAIAAGGLDGGSLKGKPLVYEDDSHVPAELRMAYKVLKNAGYLPPELETRREINRLEELIAATEDEHLRLRQMKKLKVLNLKLSHQRRRHLHLEDAEYRRKITEKITVGGRATGGQR
ncbi:DUF1992 domain-containing protein [Desulfurivibrio alkaliphilus]|uniref:DnaJ-like, subfamily C, member 28, conserved domain protein n=1 Tax=Desulfurivibrio alkaliphilus (strain DSM 19089 / UNIQEM U267 / AHT2) TaxID=589865 RepID=D6Z2A9_DESAT|nr:DUF1992 domain-containing protein [Desulfurivibrio alkaliphilus]ADH85684.1 DnaJ-like, subfamily C, member 28, conserved domain protein [Desulfurivibrio alkaliphilus AHT 2]